MTRVPVVVRKYGGSSVADLGRLRRIADELARASQAGHPLVVVVSAMGKTTSELIALAEQAGSAGGVDELPRRELDMLVSTGERVTMALLSIILHGLGQQAVSFTGSQSGIITTDRHFDARVVEVRPHRLERALSEGRIAIVAGYQGVSRSGEITTLGRGGSDTTAVALAGALGAQRCEIYSDVDGVYTSDPHRVREAKHLPWIGYDFMAAMADAGARVLNREAVRLARQSGTRIIARSSFSDAPVPRETQVTSDAEAPACRALVELVDAVRLSGPLESWPCFVEATTSLGLALPETRRDRMHWHAWLKHDKECLAKLERALPQLAIEPGRCLVSLVGSAASDAPAAAALLAKYAEHVFTAPLRASALLSPARARALVPELHRTWTQLVSTFQPVRAASEGFEGTHEAVEVGARVLFGDRDEQTVGELGADATQI